MFSSLLKPVYLFSVLFVGSFCFISEIEAQVESSIIIKTYEYDTKDTLDNVIIHKDRRRFGRTNKNGILKKPIPIGQYEFEARKKGFKSESKIVKVVARTDSIEFFLSKTVGINISAGDIQDAIVIVDSLVMGKTPLKIPSITLDHHSFQIIKEGYTIIDTLINVEHDSQSIDIKLKLLDFDITEEVEVSPDSVELTAAMDNSGSEQSYKLVPKGGTRLSIHSDFPIKKLQLYINNNKVSDHIHQKGNQEIEVTDIEQLYWKKGPNVFKLFFLDSLGTLKQNALQFVEGITKEYPFEISIDPTSVQIDSSIFETDYYYFFLNSVKVNYSGPVDIGSARFFLNNKDITNSFAVTDTCAILIPAKSKQQLKLLHEDENTIEVFINENKGNFPTGHRKYSFARRLNKIYHDLTNYNNYVDIFNIEPKFKVNQTRAFEINSSVFNFQLGIAKENLGIFDTFNSITFHLAPIVGRYFSSLPRSRSLIVNFPAGVPKDDDSGTLSCKGTIEVALEGNRRANRGLLLSIYDEFEYFYFGSLIGESPPDSLKKFIPTPFVKNFMGFKLTNLNHKMNGAFFSIGVVYNGLHKDNKSPRFGTVLFVPIYQSNRKFVPFLKLEIDTDFSTANDDIKLSGGFNTIFPFSFF